MEVFQPHHPPTPSSPLCGEKGENITLKCGGTPPTLPVEAPPLNPAALADQLPAGPMGADIAPSPPPLFPAQTAGKRGE